MSIDVMKQALEALTVYDGTNGESKRKRVLAALRDALTEAVQEPVAWMWADGTITTDPDRADGTWTPLYTAPVDAVNIKLKHVDKTAKRRHEPRELKEKNT